MKRRLCIMFGLISLVLLSVVSSGFPFCVGDTNCDGVVDGSDLANLAGDFGTTDCGTCDDVTARIADLEQKVALLQDLLQHFTRDGDDIYIDGANLHIRSGSGQTYGPVNGLGNLIVGYNELRGTSSDDRTGSHNIVVGRKNSYSSYGGLVTGYNNSITGYYAAVTGGTLNEASGNYASVSGGNNNKAKGYGSSVSGGVLNVSIYEYCSVSGGRNNSAGYDDGYSFYGLASSISGGSYNITRGDYASVSGGGGVNSTEGNVASGTCASISGGRQNTTVDSAASVSGGYKNTASGYLSSVSGGYNGNVTGTYDWTGGDSCFCNE